MFQRFAPYVALTGLVFAAYWPSIHGDFLFDDVSSIPQNASIRDLSRIDVVLSPLHTGGKTHSGRPVLNLTFALNYAIGRLDVRHWHVTNWLIHAAAAGCLYATILTTCLRGNVAPGIRRAAQPLAWWIAACWAVHPLMASAVAYIVQRAESLAALCLLAILLVTCQLLRGWTPRTVFLVISGLGIVGAFTKETCFVAPACVLLYDRAYLGRSWRELACKRGIHHAAFTTVMIAAACVAQLQNGRGDTVGASATMSRWDYLLIQGENIVSYLASIFLPCGLVVDYGVQATGLTPSKAVATALVTLLLISTFHRYWRAPRGALPAALFWILLAPSSSIVPIVTQTGGEQRMYLPSACVVITVFVGVFRVGRLLWRRQWRLSGSPTTVAHLSSAAILAALLITTNQRMEVFQSPDAFWGYIATRAPGNLRAVRSWCLSLAGAGQCDAAIRLCDRSVSIEAQKTGALLARGTCHEHCGNADAALQDYQQALALSPANPDVHSHLAVHFRKHGQADRALAHFTRAIELEKHATHFANRGDLLRHLGRNPEALADLQRAIAIQPWNYEALFGLASLHYDLAHDDLAEAAYRQCLKYFPDDAPSHYWLATRGQWVDAHVHALAAAAADSNPQYHAFVSQTRMRVDRIKPSSLPHDKSGSL